MADLSDKARRLGYHSLFLSTTFSKKKRKILEKCGAAYFFHSFRNQNTNKTFSLTRCLAFYVCERTGQRPDHPRGLAGLSGRLGLEDHEEGGLELHPPSGGREQGAGGGKVPVVHL